MNTITLWLLIVTSGTNTHGGPIVVDRFVNESDCSAAAVRIKKQSADTPAMKYLYGVCVEAKVYKP